jgi:hypothetical protein
VCYTPKGLAWYSEWGTLRNTNNAVFLATLMGKHGASAASRQQHMCWARRCVAVAPGVPQGGGRGGLWPCLDSIKPLVRLPVALCIMLVESGRQMRYTLGSAGSARSYVIGYGPSQPQRPHHRQSACAATYTAPCSLVNSGTCCAGESGAPAAPLLTCV